MNSFSTVFFSLLLGVLPALFWLWFWLKEDKLHPEPKARIMLSFLAGMASIFIVLPLEKLVFAATFSQVTVLTIILWAGVEEIFKFSSAYFTGLRNKEMDEPIDGIIYMITAALGFSALENALFLSNLINLGLFSETIITSNSRFLGATLLHVASSAVIGLMIGLFYYKSRNVKRFFLFTGLVLAIILHTIFNLLIIRLENNTFLVFSGVWVLIILILVLIEKVKRIYS